MFLAGSVEVEFIYFNTDYVLKNEINTQSG
jgi:hypothetical protein